VIPAIDAELAGHADKLDMKLQSLYGNGFFLFAVRILAKPYHFGVNWPKICKNKDGVHFFTHQFEWHNRYNKLLLCNFANNDTAWCNKTGFPHNFHNQIPWHSMAFSMTFPWPLLHFFHACWSDTYTCKLVTVLLKIADVALMGSSSAKLAPCVVAVSHLKTKPTLLSISTSYLHCQI